MRKGDIKMENLRKYRKLHIPLLCSILIICSSCAPLFIKAPPEPAPTKTMPAKVALKKPIIKKSVPIKTTPTKTEPSKPDSWIEKLPVPPGDSLKDKEGRQKQIVTFFEMNDIRYVNNIAFISGRGFAQINDGEQTFPSANRDTDHYLEVTVTSPDSSTFEECKKIFDKEHLTQNAITISGNGLFASRPGIGGLKLGVFRLDTISDCKLVPR